MSFKSNKAAGPDGFKSTALKHFVQNKIGLARLTMLFKACIELSYCPKDWAIAKVIFMEKPNKVDMA